MKSLHLGRGLFGFIVDNIFYTYRCKDSGRKLGEDYTLEQEADIFGEIFVQQPPRYDTFPKAEFRNQDYPHYGKCVRIKYAVVNEEYPGVRAFRDRETGNIVVFYFTTDLSAVTIPPSDTGHFDWVRAKVYEGPAVSLPPDLEVLLNGIDLPKLWMPEDFWLPQHEEDWHV